MKTVRKVYKLRLHISLKYITANVIDQANGQLVAQVSTIEHPLKRAFDLGRTTKAPQAAAVVGDVLSRRIKLEAITHHHGLRQGIYADVFKDVNKKGVGDVSANSDIVWAVINSLRDNGIKIIVNDANHSG